MDTAAFVITTVGLAVVLLGAFWKFSHDQGKQTQLIEGLGTQMREWREEIRADLARGTARMDKIESEQQKLRSSHDWMLGKMGTKPKDMD